MIFFSNLLKPQEIETSNCLLFTQYERIVLHTTRAFFKSIGAENRRQNLKCSIEIDGTWYMILIFILNRIHSAYTILFRCNVSFENYD